MLDEIAIEPRNLGLPSKFSSFRPEQDDCIRAICRTMHQSPRRFVCIEGPTGSGKTLINVSLAKMWGGRALYLTGQKTLQDQLTLEFPSADLRGHTAYGCAINRKLRLGPLDLVPKGDNPTGVKLCSRPSGKCEYVNALTIAKESNLVVSNYAQWLTLARTGRHNELGKFDILILDEAHSIEDWLSKFCTFQLLNRDSKALLDMHLPVQSNYKEWVREALDTARDRYSKTRVKSDRSLLKHLGDHLAVICHTIEVDEVDWLISRSLDRVHLTPVWPWPFAEDYLWRGIEWVVLSSSTLLKTSVGRLGIPEGQRHWYTVPSTFPAYLGPIRYLDLQPRIRVSRTTDTQSMVRLVNRIDHLIEDRPDRKGLVVAVSYHLAKAILRLSRCRDRLITHEPGRSKAAIAKYLASTDPVVLLSPSVTEGLDLIDDLCRFIIFPKIPFPGLEDPLTKARSRERKEYGYELTAKSMIQTVGRGRRHQGDWCETLILDANWTWFRHTIQWPARISDSLQWETGYPAPWTPKPVIKLQGD